MSKTVGAGAPFDEMFADLTTLGEHCVNTLTIIRAFFDEGPVLNRVAVDLSPASRSGANYGIIGKEPSEGLVRAFAAARASYKKGCPFCTGKSHEILPNGSALEAGVSVLKKWFGEGPPETERFYRMVAVEMLRTISRPLAQGLMELVPPGEDSLAMSTLDRLELSIADLLDNSDCLESPK